MPTEAELRALLHGEDDGTPRLDAERIIARARARRRPKRLAVGALGGLAAAAVVVPVALGVGTMRPMGASDSAGSAAAPESSDSSVLKGDSARTPVEGSATSCVPPLWDGDPAPEGVALTVMQEVGGSEVDLTLRNDGADAVDGTLAADPTLLFLTDGIVVGWSATAVADPRVDLAPGRELVMTAPLAAVDCAGAPLAPGSYDAEAVLPIRRTDGTITVVTGDPAAVTVGSAQ